MRLTFLLLMFVSFSVAALPPPERITKKSVYIHFPPKAHKLDSANTAELKIIIGEFRKIRRVVFYAHLRNRIERRRCEAIAKVIRRKRPYVEFKVRKRKRGTARYERTSTIPVEFIEIHIEGKLKRK